MNKGTVLLCNFFGILVVSCFLFWVDDEVDRPVFDACNSGGLPHVDSATDGFADDKFAVVLWHRFKGHHVSPAKLVEEFACFGVG